MSATSPLAGIAAAAPAHAAAPAAGPASPPSPPSPAPVAAPQPAPAADATPGTSSEAAPSPPPEGGAAPAAPEVSPTLNEPIPSLEPPPAFPELPALPEAPPPPAKRMKALRMSTGAAPTAVDLGSEVDISSGGGLGDGAGVEDTAANQVNKGWWFSLKGYVRAPMRLSLGPRADGASGRELHTPPRVPGQASGDWTYLAIASNPVVNIYATVGNSRLSANVIMSANTITDGGFQDLDQIGGISQAYVTLKFPDAFGSRGGIAWTAGNFSMRYGNAGPGERSSGYYSSYLFGRTHTAGEDLTADIDLTDRIELTVEHAIGAMIEPVPFDAGQLKNGFLPTATTLEGSTFVHHAHALLSLDDWLRMGFHWLTCWSPNDTSNPHPLLPDGTRLPNSEGRLTVYGADLHMDGLGIGSGYIGYSRATAENINILGPALQVVHGTSGTGFARAYFGKKDPASNTTPSNDQGTVDTILFQYIVRLGRLMGKSPIGRDVTLGLFGMYSHVHSDPHPGAGHLHELAINDNRLKVGGEGEVKLHKYLNVGLRLDYVQPNLTDRSPSERLIAAGGSDTFWTLSPRLIIHTNWKSKEYVIVDYTHYFLGSRAYPGSPYSTVLKADPNMLSVTALFSF